MITFIPEQVIRSADLNANFSELANGTGLVDNSVADTNEGSQFYILGGVFTNISGFLVSI